MECITASGGDDGTGFSKEDLEFIAGAIGHLASLGAIVAESRLAELGSSLATLAKYMDSKGLSGLEQLDYVTGSTSMADDAAKLANTLEVLKAIGNAFGVAGTVYDGYNFYQDPSWETGNNVVAGGVLTGVGLSGAKIAASLTGVGAAALLAAQATAYGLDKYWDAKEGAQYDAERNGSCNYLKNSLEDRIPCEL